MQDRLKIEFITEELQIGHLNIRLRRVRNLDQLVDQISEDEFNVDERLPYWAELWPSALGLSHILIGQPELIRGRRVLELGIGLGLTSLVLATTEPSELLLTDYEEDALRICADNFRLNGLQPPPMQLLDWRYPDLEERFDVIVASDVLYERRFFAPLLDLFGRYLNKSGYVLLSEPNRSIAREFFRMLQQAGFDYQRCEEQVQMDGRTIPISIYQICPPAGLK